MSVDFSDDFWIGDSSSKRKDSNKMNPERDSDGQKVHCSWRSFHKISPFILDLVNKHMNIFDSVC